MTLSETLQLQETIRSYENLRDVPVQSLAEQYNVTISQINFVIVTIATERM